MRDHVGSIGGTASISSSPYTQNISISWKDIWMTRIVVLRLQTTGNCIRVKRNCSLFLLARAVTARHFDEKM